MALLFLDFDYSEDDEGTATWDALASATADRLPELVQEVTTVLAWAHATFGALRGPVEHGGLWDYDAQCERAGQPLQPLRYDPQAGTLQPAPQALAGERITLSLTLSGGPAFAHALTARFALA